MVAVTAPNDTLVRIAALQVAQNGTLIEILDNLALLSLDSRLAIFYQLSDIRLRQLECVGTRPGEMYNTRIGEYNTELQIMWSLKHKLGWEAPQNNTLKYLHLMRYNEGAITTWAEFTDRILEIKQEWESNQALRYFDPRRIYWENHFRDHVSRSHRDNAATLEECIDILDQLYENIVSLVKLNSRDIDEYTVERIVRLKALQKIELHHPPKRHRISQDSDETTIWSLFLQLLQRQRVVCQLGLYHGNLQSTQLLDLSEALRSRVDRFGPAAGMNRFELVSIKLTDDRSDKAASSDCSTESNAVDTLCATIKKLEYLKTLRISGSFFTSGSTSMERSAAKLVCTAFHLPKLKSLCLDHGDLEDNVFERALNSLISPATPPMMCSITSIHLGDNSITAQTLITLCQVISIGQWKLKRLDLHGSLGIGDEGIDSLARILANSDSCSLEDLDLSNCNLSVDGVRMLCTALETNHSMQRIDLSSNFLSPLFGGLLANLLQCNTTLNTLQCEYIGLTDAGCTDELIRALQNNLALTGITLGSNRLGDNGSTKVFDALIKRSLKKPYLKIDLTGNLITSVGLNQMLMMLQQQTHNEVLDRNAISSNKRARYSLYGTRSKSDVEPDSTRPPKIEQLILLDNRFDTTNCDLRQMRKFIYSVEANEWTRSQ